MAEATAEELVRFDSGAGRWVIIGAVLGSGIVFLDGTVVNVALPRLGEDLDADFTGLQWVLNGYLLTLASLILVGGALGDRLGRRRMFSLGVAWFAVASLLCAVAPSVPFLVVARLLQGAAGALLTPASLAIIQASFHPDDRARAIGAWSGFAGITTALGPFLGGWLVDVASWRWIFLLNLPLAAVALFVAIRHIPESVDPTIESRLDYGGAALGAVALAGINFGFIEESWVLGISGLVAFALFILLEARERHPMLPLGIFRSRQFSAANGVTLAVYGALGMVLFLLSLVLQRSLGYSPLEAGAATFPITVVMLAFSARAGALAQRIGPRLPMTIGPLLIGLGLVLMIRVEVGSTYLSDVFPAILVFSAGLALTVAPLTSTVLAAADNRHAGVASGVNNAVARAAGLLAVAAVPLLAGFEPGGEVPADELIDGFRVCVLGAGGLAAAGGLLSLATIRADLLESEPEQEPCYHCGGSGPPLQVNVETAHR